MISIGSNFHYKLWKFYEAKELFFLSHLDLFGKGSSSSSQSWSGSNHSNNKTMEMSLNGNSTPEQPPKSNTKVIRNLL